MQTPSDILDLAALIRARSASNEARLLEMAVCTLARACEASTRFLLSQNCEESQRAETIRQNRHAIDQAVRCLDHIRKADVSVARHLADAYHAGRTAALCAAPPLRLSLPYGRHDTPEVDT